MVGTLVTLAFLTSIKSDSNRLYMSQAFCPLFYAITCHMYGISEVTFYKQCCKIAI